VRRIASIALGQVHLGFPRRIRVIRALESVVEGREWTGGNTYLFELLGAEKEFRLLQITLGSYDINVKLPAPLPLEIAASKGEKP